MKKNSRGMTLIEVTVAMGILAIISTAIITMAVATISVANNAKFKNQATRLAQDRIEVVKNTESINRASIQNGDFTSISNLADETTVANNSINYFRKTTVTTLADKSTVTVTVGWDFKGTHNCTTSPLFNCVVLTTVVNKWK